MTTRLCRTMRTSAPASVMTPLLPVDGVHVEGDELLLLQVAQAVRDRLGVTEGIVLALVRLACAELV